MVKVVFAGREAGKASDGGWTYSVVACGHEWVLGTKAYCKKYAKAIEEIGLEEADHLWWQAQGDMEFDPFRPPYLFHPDGPGEYTLLGGRKVVYAKG